LAQAKITEEENKMSLKRIVEAEEERARKRREKLEALRRRRFDEPIIRFLSKRGSLIEEVPDEEEEVEIVVDDVIKGEEVKKEPDESILIGDGNDAVEEKDQKKENEGKQSGVDDGKMDVDEAATEKAPVDLEGTSLTANDTSAPLLDEQMDVDHVEKPAAKVQQIDDNETTTLPDATALVPPHSPTRAPLETEETETTKAMDATAPTKEASKSQSTAADGAEPSAPKDPQPAPIPPSAINPTPPNQTPTPPRSPPPYHEAHFTLNTMTYIPLPTHPNLPSTRETFFPNIPLQPPAKPKPSARCPITGLPARYKDPLSGVGYYDIHAFKILREVGRRGGRYVWCSEGGWFVGETGWGGRGAKGVPEGWNG